MKDNPVCFIASRIILNLAAGSVSIKRSIAFTKFPPNAAFNIPACFAASSNVSNLATNARSFGNSIPVSLACIAMPLNAFIPASPNFASSLEAFAKSAAICAGATPIPIAKSFNPNNISSAWPGMTPIALVII